jgi:hypothetical protein
VKQRNESGCATGEQREESECVTWVQEKGRKRAMNVIEMLQYLNICSPFSNLVKGVL